MYSNNKSSFFFQGKLLTVKLLKNTQPSAIYSVSNLMKSVVYECVSFYNDHIFIIVFSSYNYRIIFLELCLLKLRFKYLKQKVLYFTTQC